MQAYTRSCFKNDVSMGTENCHAIFFIEAKFRIYITKPYISLSQQIKVELCKYHVQVGPLLCPVIQYFIS